jgi:23S rRNA (guanosine2251-2'-O)-methyltransferase
VTAPRELVYGRHPVREVLRAGRRQVLELLASKRAVETEPWVQGASVVRPRVVPDATLAAASGTKDHQGVVAFCEPYRYADAWEIASGERPLIVCLDGVTDPQNLGAVCRSAEGAGASGLVLPEHRSARVTAAV